MKLFITAMLAFVVGAVGALVVSVMNPFRAEIRTAAPISIQSAEGFTLETFRMEAPRMESP